MKCPRCNCDIRNTVVLKAAGAIIARRRRRAGNQITSTEARELQAKSAAARKANAAAREDKQP